MSPRRGAPPGSGGRSCTPPRTVPLSVSLPRHTHARPGPLAVASGQREAWSGRRERPYMRRRPGRRQSPETSACHSPILAAPFIFFPPFIRFTADLPTARSLIRAPFLPDGLGPFRVAITASSPSHESIERRGSIPPSSLTFGHSRAPSVGCLPERHHIGCRQL